MKQLVSAGVRVFCYLSDSERTLDSPIEKAMLALQTMADELEREKARQRTTDAMLQKARAGYVTGGRTYGYDNIEVRSATGARSHVERRVNEGEAEVVRRIFTLYASGLGLKSVATQLSRERVPAPKNNDGQDLGWSPSTIRSMLRRELYRGVAVYNKTKKRDQWGKREHNREKKARPEADWLRVQREEWSIVPEELWNHVRSRRKVTEGQTLRFERGVLSGRPPKDAIANLLSGVATCGVCGRGMNVETSKGSPGKPRVAHYVCGSHWRNGSCPNDLRMPVEDVNEAVLLAIEEHALTPEAIEAVVQLTERDDLRERQAQVAHDQQTVAKQIDRLTTAIANGADIPSLVAKLQELEARQRTLAADAAALRPLPRLAPAVVENRLAEWRRLLRGSVTQGRAVLQRVLRGRIVFRPIVDDPLCVGYEFDAPTRYDRLFAGVALTPRSMAEADRVPAFVPVGAATGTEALRAHEAQQETDYGLLLERVTENGKVLASPRGTGRFYTLRSATPRRAA